MNKKILNLLFVLSASTCLSIAGTQHAAAEKLDNFEYTTVDNMITITACDEYATSINIPAKINDMPVTTIGEGAFETCLDLTDITLPDGITTIGKKAFQNCIALSQITLPDTVTNIGDFAFDDCRRLTSLTIPNKVTTIGNCSFRHCSKLTSIYFPESVTTICYDALLQCKSLTSITVAENNPNYTSFDGNLYNKDKTKLIIYAIGKKDKSFYIPNSVTTIGNSAFCDCSSLNEVIIPNSVTNISMQSFVSCINLEYVTIPDSITSIGKYAFNYCHNLKDIYYCGTKEQWNKINISDNNNNLNSVNIYHNCTGPYYNNTIQDVSENNNIVSVKLNNLSDKTYDSVMLIVGIYDQNDCLYALKTQQIKNFTSDYNKCIDVPFDNINADSCIKTFVWTSFEDLTPLSKNISINY